MENTLIGLILQCFLKGRNLVIVDLCTHKSVIRILRTNEIPLFRRYATEQNPIFISVSKC